MNQPIYETTARVKDLSTGKWSTIRWQHHTENKHEAVHRKAKLFPKGLLLHWKCDHHHQWESPPLTVQYKARLNTLLDARAAAGGTLPDVEESRHAEALDVLWQQLTPEEQDAIDKSK